MQGRMQGRLRHLHAQASALMYIGQQTLFGSGQDRLGFGAGGVQIQLGVDPIIENVCALYRQAVSYRATVIITEIGFDDGQ